MKQFNGINILTEENNNAYMKHFIEINLHYDEDEQMMPITAVFIFALVQYQIANTPYTKMYIRFHTEV